MSHQAGEVSSSQIDDDVSEVQNAVLELDDDERAALAERLLESLDGDESSASRDEVDKAWRVEIKDRLDEARRGEVQFIDGNEVMARLAREFG